MCICRNGLLQARNEGNDVVMCSFMSHRTPNEFLEIRNAYEEKTHNNCVPNGECPFWNYGGREAQENCPLFG